MSVQPARHNFKMWKGATFRYTFTYLSGGETSSPKDLSGYSASMVLKDPRTNNTLLTLTSSNGGIILGGAAGTIEIRITAELTSAITWQQATYQLTITQGPDTDVLLYGTISATGI